MAVSSPIRTQDTRPTDLASRWHGRTALDLAAMYGMPDITNLLLAHSYTMMTPEDMFATARYVCDVDNSAGARMLNGGVDGSYEQTADLFRHYITSLPTTYDLTSLKPTGFWDKLTGDGANIKCIVGARNNLLLIIRRAL